MTDLRNNTKQDGIIKLEKNKQKTFLAKYYQQNYFLSQQIYANSLYSTITHHLRDIWRSEQSMYTSSVCLFSPDQSIQCHPGSSLSLHHVCNMSQQSTWGSGHANTWDTHTYTQIPCHQLSRSCWIDKITPCGAALTPPGSPPLLSAPAPSLCNMAVSLPIRPSCHSAAARAYVRQLHRLTPGVDNGGGRE